MTVNIRQITLTVKVPDNTNADKAFVELYDRVCETASEPQFNGISPEITNTVDNSTYYAGKHRRGQGHGNECSSTLQ